MAFIFFIETPIGILNTRSIMEVATGDQLPFRSEAGVFGSDDFLASLGKWLIQYICWMQLTTYLELALMGLITIELIISAPS